MVRIHKHATIAAETRREIALSRFGLLVGLLFAYFGFAACASVPHYGGVETDTPRDEKVRVVPVGVSTIAINSRSHAFKGKFFIPPGSYTMLLGLSSGYKSKYKQKVSFTVGGGKQVFLCAGKDRAQKKWKPHVKIAPPEPRWWFSSTPDACSWAE